MESESECSEPPAKRKFVPSKDTMKFLQAVTDKPLKNDKRKSATSKFLYTTVIRFTLRSWMTQ